MPYPHVTQLETRLRLDRMPGHASLRRRRLRRPRWLALRIVDIVPSRNVGG
jgi:hypothetical protein